MLKSPEIVDEYNYCSHCLHSTGSAFQLKNHVQRNHKNDYAAELFNAIFEPEQFSCICCDYKSYYRFELYEHYRQVHNLETGNKENGTFCEARGRYSCGDCKYELGSSLFLLKHQDMCGKEPIGVPEETTEKAEGVKSPHLKEAVIKDVEAIGLSMPMHDSSEKIEELKRSRFSHPHKAKRKSDLRNCVVNNRRGTGEENCFQCNHCSYQTNVKSNLKTHILSKHTPNEEINWFQCKHCSYRGKQKAHLKIHMLQHAANEEINWFHCNHCSYRAKVQPLFASS